MRMRRPAALTALPLLAALVLSACGTADIAASRSRGTAGTPKPAPTPVTQQSAGAMLSGMLVTYPPDSPCSGVLVDTPIEQVPPACAAEWSPIHVFEVPGQSLLQRAPKFASVLAGPGVSPELALRYAAAFWRTEAFDGFAMGTRQVPVVVPLGEDYLFVRIGAMEKAVNAGDVVTTPLCHFFPTTMTVLQLAPDLAAHEKRPAGSLGVLARFQGPCYATATNAQGVKRELFNFSNTYDVVFVGDIHNDAPFGPILWLTGLAECSKPLAMKTCAA